jgi:hypothetical protein
VRLGATVTATVTARHAHPGETVEVAANIVRIAESTPLKLGQRVEIEILGDEHG